MGQAGASAAHDKIKKEAAFMGGLFKFGIR